MFTLPLKEMSSDFQFWSMSIIGPVDDSLHSDPRALVIVIWLHASVVPIPWMGFGGKWIFALFDTIQYGIHTLSLSYLLYSLYSYSTLWSIRSITILPWVDPLRRYGHFQDNGGAEGSSGVASYFLLLYYLTYIILLFCFVLFPFFPCPLYRYS